MVVGKWRRGRKGSKERQRVIKTDLAKVRGKEEQKLNERRQEAGSRGQRRMPESRGQKAAVPRSTAAKSAK
jgi:hypothetical protein